MLVFGSQGAMGLISDVEKGVQRRPKLVREGCAYRKQHVLLVLVDSSGVGDRVGVFDDRYRLP